MSSLVSSEDADAKGREPPPRGADGTERLPLAEDPLERETGTAAVAPTQTVRTASRQWREAHGAELDRTARNC